MKPLKLDEIASAIAARPLGQLGRFATNAVSIDSRQVKTGELFFAIEGERHDGHDYVASAIDRGAMAAVVSKPDRVPADLHQLGLLLLVDDTTAALGRLAAFHRRQVRASVIGVTGSNGKTTTKEMIHHVLSGRRRGTAAPKSFNNAIGVPLTLLAVDPDDDYVVVEIGSNAPGEVAELARLAAPDIGVITSVSETHLDKLGSLEGVAREKASLVEHIREGGRAVITGESTLLDREVRTRCPRTVRRVTFGFGEDLDLRAADIEIGVGTIGFRVNDGAAVTLPMPGRHNVINALATIAVAEEFTIGVEEAAERLADFRLPSMRLEVHRWGEVTLINDAYNANPASMAAALDVLVQWPDARRRVFVAGDMRELGEVSQAKHEELGRRVAAANIDVLMAVGEFAETVAKSARKANGRIEIEIADDTASAAGRLGGLIRAGDVVMLKGSRAVGLEVLAGAIQAEAQGEPGG